MTGAPVIELCQITAFSASRRCTTQARRGPAAVAFQAELALQRPDDRLGALARPVREVPRLLVVFPGRAGQVQAQTGEELLEVVPGEALVRDDRGAAAGPAGRLRGEQLLDSLAFARQPGAGQAEAVTVPSQVTMSMSLAPRQ